ncbi:MAG: PHP domain-containing protein [Bacteroidetes bacterium]|nr:PHP domain-containing protein [Bacteroidota bacterium]
MVVVVDVALTDSGAGYGLIDFYEQAQKLKDIKPILGAEIFVARDSRFERRAGIDGQEGHVVLIAKNKTGYQFI